MPIFEAAFAHLALRLLEAGASCELAGDQKHAQGGSEQAGVKPGRGVSVEK